MYKINRLIKSFVWFLCSLAMVLGGVLYLGWSQSHVQMSDLDHLLPSNLVLAGSRLINGESGRNASEGAVLDENGVEITTGQLEEAADEEVLRAEARDARAKLVANFIERNDSGGDSPLQPYDEYGQLFVDIADEFGLDFRLLPAIARKESTFCKSNVARKYYNCFGYGVPASGITEAGMFDSYEEGIRVVAASLKKNYLDKGLTSPEEIMKKYCPPSAEGSGTWADHLNQWLAEMRYDDKSAGQALKENVDLTEEI